MPQRAWIATALCLAWAGQALADGTGGIFIAIGGGPERPDIMQTVLRLMGGRDGKAVIMPMASGDPAASGQAYKQLFASAGVRDIESLALTTRDNANDLGPVKAIGRASMLYFTGGDQNRLVNLLSNTAVHGSIQTAWERQTLLVGTSAGAMVWGPEFIANGTSRGALMLGFTRDADGVPGLELRPGLNLWDSLILDTHFTEQQRLGRLLLAVASTPGSSGLGVDEGTAAVVTGDTIQVLGAGAVTILEADTVTTNTSQQVGPGAPLALGKVTMHRLLAGASYLRKWKAVSDEKALPPAPALGPTVPYVLMIGSDVPRKGLTPVHDFVGACGGNQARILLLTGEKASQGARMWKTFLLKQGAQQVVSYQSMELSDQGLGIALQHATGIFFLEDAQASLLRSLLANQGRLAAVLAEAGKRLPLAAAGNAVRLFGARAAFGTPGQADFQTLPGLGLLPTTVIDKTFWSAEAQERLMRTQLAADRALGIGLSADNSLIVSGGQASVAGESQVMFLDDQQVTGFKLPPDSSGQPTSASHMLLSVVPPNGSYDLVKREPRL